jgi:hypothetical protein
MDRAEGITPASSGADVRRYLARLLDSRELGTLLGRLDRYGYDLDGNDVYGARLEIRAFLVHGFVDEEGQAWEEGITTDLAHVLAACSLPWNRAREISKQLLILAKVSEKNLPPGHHWCPSGDGGIVKDEEQSPVLAADFGITSSEPQPVAPRGSRAALNTAERTRRIRENHFYEALRQEVPTLHGQPGATKRTILDRAAEQVQHLTNYEKYLRAKLQRALSLGPRATLMK